MNKIYFYNTLTKEKQEFVPIDPKKITLYSCGPTVYNYAHIGNLRSYVMMDTLKRVLLGHGYNITHIMNVTDIGHLTGDTDDSGEDKMVKALLREGKPLTLESLKEVGEYYFAKFKDDLDVLSIIRPDKFVFASDEIPEQVRLIEELKTKGYTYETSDGIYFDTDKLPDYGILGGGVSVEHSRIGINQEKKNPRDFALWKFSKENDIGFEASFGKGFPGWHIECSAMSMKYLGTHFDIHTGGVDHIQVHHNNEIAQGEALTGKIPANFWIHNEHLTIKNQKMAKSEGNILSLSYLQSIGISPLSFKYYYLSSKYNTRLDYSEEALHANEKAYKKLLVFLANEKEIGSIHEEYKQKFLEAVRNDLDTPKALSIIWDLIKEKEIENKDKKATVLFFDKFLGLELDKAHEVHIHINEEVKELLEKRKEARLKKDWNTSDILRDQIRKHGFEVKDTEDDQILEEI